VVVAPGGAGRATEVEDSAGATAVSGMAARVEVVGSGRFPIARLGTPTHFEPSFIDSNGIL
jgi:hypothetical protein